MRVDRREIAAIFVGGFAGAMLLGWLVTRLQERLPLSAYRRPLLGTGFCGALTTYSTFSYETLRLAQDGNRFQAALNAIVSVVAGLGAAGLGLLVAQAT